ncbi:MAG: GGDEF domain-containing protein, partial [Oscillospiraceae bacterium]|nr:GGDEF domain-containing protein [Oscillospiraceae bacterium]
MGALGGGNGGYGGSGDAGALSVDVVGAYDYFVRAKDIFTALGDAEGRMLACLLLGHCLFESSQYGEAETAFAGALGEAGGDKTKRLCGNVAIDALCGLGSIRVAQQRCDEANAYFSKALDLCAEERNMSKQAGVMYWLGLLGQINNNSAEARRMLLGSVEIAARDAEYRTAASASRALSRGFFESGQFDMYEYYSDLASRYVNEAAKEEAGSEIKNLRSYYVKENARIIANAEQHLRESLLERNVQLEEANWQLNTIYNIGQSITALLDIGEVLRTLYTELRALMHLDSFFIASYNDESNLLEYQIMYEDGQEVDFSRDGRRQVPAGDLAYLCVYKNDTLVIEDVASMERGGGALGDRGVALGGRLGAALGGMTGGGTADGGSTNRVLNGGGASHALDVGDANRALGGEGAARAFGSAVYTCLRTKGRLFGVLCVRSKKTRSYNNHQAKLLDAVSSYVSIALDNATIYQKLDEVSRKVAELANHDTLTGIPNRRLLMELVPKAYANALRTNSKVAFLFMDLDNFKIINDKYGHQAGDEVLRVFKDRVLGLIRSTDIFARMGGDEFVVVMTDLKISLNAGTLARKIIRETAKPIMIEGADNNIGVSIGISIYPEDSKDTDVLIVMADEAMYRVKREYKNNFTFFNEINDER